MSVAAQVGTPSIWEFSQRLKESGLLPLRRLRELQREIDVVCDTIRTESFAKRLIRQGDLTEWQVQMLYADRHTFYLGPYRLMEVIGRGGMGSVFRAEHKQLKHVVAIKVLSRKLAQNPDIVTCFRREIEVAASISSPYVVRAIDAGCEEGRYFLVMEYVDGQNLSEVLRQREQGKLFVGEACEYARQAALGLQHGYEKGMIHRDVKPGNLILSWDARQQPLVKLLDMGLARFAWEDESDWETTRKRRTMGTPDYMSPEQGRESGVVDIRSDIFSLGCTLFRLLTGKFPYSGRTAKEKLLARQRQIAPPPSIYDSSIPPAVDVFVGKMLERDPNKRYQTPAEVARDLARVAAAPNRTTLEALKRGALKDADTTIDAAAHETFAVEMNRHKSGQTAVAAGR